MYYIYYIFYCADKEDLFESEVRRGFRRIWYKTARDSDAAKDIKDVWGDALGLRDNIYIIKAKDFGTFKLNAVKDVSKLSGDKWKFVRK